MFEARKLQEMLTHKPNGCHHCYLVGGFVWLQGNIRQQLGQVLKWKVMLNEKWCSAAVSLSISKQHALEKMTDIQLPSSYSSMLDFRDSQLPKAFLISDGSKAQGIEKSQWRGRTKLL